MIWLNLYCVGALVCGAIAYRVMFLSGGFRLTSDLPESQMRLARVLAVVVVALTWPFMALIAAALKLSSMGRRGAG